MKRLLVYSKKYWIQMIAAAISSVTASISTVMVIDILREIIDIISKGNMMQEIQYIYFENNNCDMCWYCIKLYVSCNDRFCRCWIVKGF